MISFANSLDAYQDRQSVGPYLDQNCLTMMRIFLKELFEKKMKKYQMPKEHAKLPSKQRVMEMG